MYDSPTPPALEFCSCACAPGLAAYREALPLLDLACMHAAACDLAIADVAFGTAVSSSGVGMAQALISIAQRAQRDFPASPERYEVVALMGFQSARLERPYRACSCPMPCHVL